MAREPNPRVLLLSTRPTTWLGKLAVAVIGLTLLVLAFFFLTVALVAGVIVGLAVIGRLWWISRKLRRAREQADLDGEFTVVERRDSIQHIDNSPSRNP
ncbi:MAG: hypothetical protein A2W68_15040 [Betaproteobacteria bacterium RIFCSPLOWO2_02_64_14]|nr:MAG: hypothetical protein A2W68_15040 [Betaproteobacteria bacterium RIFCSPLOWO2_02_64_14]